MKFAIYFQNTTWSRSVNCIKFYYVLYSYAVISDYLKIPGFEKKTAKKFEKLKKNLNFFWKKLSRMAS